MAPIIDDPSQVEMYSNRYICMLYRMTDRTSFRSMNAEDVFRKLSLNTFQDITRTTDEIIQYLLERGHIKFGSERQVILTLEGKGWCDNNCKETDFGAH
jgi:hypothetical protein